MPAYVVVRATTMARLRRLVQESPPADDAAARALPAMATLTLIGAAMAEGFGLFGGTVFLITAAREALLAPAIALVLLVLKIPTQDKLAAFAADAAGQRVY